MKLPDHLETIQIDALIPYARNSRTHSEAQVAQIAASIKEFGFTSPILVDKDGGIIAGHGRLLAARKLGIKQVPCIRMGHLTPTQARALVIADNKLALNAGWDEQMLALELAELQGLGFGMELIGFSKDEIAALTTKDPDDDGADTSKYTKKIDAPIYQPTGDCPPTAALYDSAKYTQLTAQIHQNNDLAPEVKEFLLFAATRHIRFDFEQIAEFYAHADPDTQQLMEESALVIIDFDKAISGGYVKLSQAMGKIYASEKGGDQ
jgi:hypothetical protein